MKPGFLNTPRSKRVIDQAYPSVAPPTPQPPRDRKPRSTSTEDARLKAARDDLVVDEPAVADRDHDGQPGSDAAGATVAGGNDSHKAVEHDVVVCTDGDAQKTAEAPVDAPEAKPPLPNLSNHDCNISCHHDAVPPGYIPARPPARRPGWGRDPREDLYHRIPPGYGGEHSKRSVFRLWPRDPNAKVVAPSDKPNGKRSPDDYSWAATLYDFFYFYRMPYNIHFRSVMTGSSILESLVESEALETEVDKDEMLWALTEGKPTVAGVANTEQLIESHESRAWLLFSMLGHVREEQESVKGDLDAQVPEDDDAKGKSNVAQRRSKAEYVGMEINHAPIPPPSTIPVTSPFHPSHYPAPWPLIPFSNNPECILLQERIPLHLLPQTLYVHDPFNVLPALPRTALHTSWKSKPDVVRTYDLKLSDSVHQEVEQARKKAEEVEEFKSRTLIIMRYERTKEQIENHEPVIEVPLPRYPPRMTTVEESHLYLSPVAKVGTGHHSVVYRGEWELPRDLLTRPKICAACFKEGVDKEIKRLKDTGRWDRMLRAFGWGPTGPTGRSPVQAELDEVNDPLDLQKDGEIIEREITCLVSCEMTPMDVVQRIDEKSTWNILMDRRDLNSARLDFTSAVEVEPAEHSSSSKDTMAPIFRINPPLSYHNPSYRESSSQCEHWRDPAPRTAKFTVVAKLSIEYDQHLAREATTYQQFPEHFFHHYTGYTLIGQLHAIVPVGAVVPQFYGYYTPRNDGTASDGSEPYLSPILLLEHCGRPIEAKKLCLDDQEECASLLLRFQRAGWLHESFAERNVLVQEGSPTEFPFTRMLHPQPSFRLIDFGRSRKFNTANEKRAEEMEALKLFPDLNGRMNVTVSL